MYRKNSKTRKKSHLKYGGLGFKFPSLFTSKKKNSHYCKRYSMANIKIKKTNFFKYIKNSSVRKIKKL